MTLHRLGERPPRRVGILRALQLGDLLCAVPALRALRAALPDAEMVLIGLPWREASFNALTCIWMAFENSPAIRAFPSKRRGSSGSEPFSMRSRPRSSTWFYRCKEAVGLPTRLRFCSARITAGFREPGGYCPDPERFLLYTDHGLEIDRLLSLVEFLGIPARGTHLEFPLRPEDYRALENIPEARRLQPGRYVCVHVGASTPARRWPLWNFVEVAGWLADRGLAIALSGTAAEAGLTASVAAQLPNGAVNLAGRTDLGCLAALLSGAALLICNDTGVSHLADALRVPSVVISTGKNPQALGPQRSGAVSGPLPGNGRAPERGHPPSEVGIESILGPRGLSQRSGQLACSGGVGPF